MKTVYTVKKTAFIADGATDLVTLVDDTAFVRAGPGYCDQGSLHCSVANTGNGYIAFFPAPTCTTQDYYVCLDYTQARDLVLGLSMFKKELGFEE
jgi:hypothetical protein